MTLLLTLAAASLGAACSSDEEDDDGSGAASSTPSSSSSAGGGGEPGVGGAGVGGEAGSAGGGASGGEGGTGGAGGAPYDGVACLTCIDPLITAGQPCERVFASCEGDAGCAAWLECTEDCFQPGAPASCWDACDATHATAAPVFEPFYGCFCADCAAVCGTACN
jgi:hypothetical protein